MYRPPSTSHDFYDKMIEYIELVTMLNKEITNQIQFISLKIYLNCRKL